MEECTLYMEINDGEDVLEFDTEFDRNNMSLPYFEPPYFEKPVLISNEYILIHETDEEFRVYPENVVFAYDDIGITVEDEIGNGIVTYG